MRRLRPRGWKQWCGAIVLGSFACGLCSILGLGLLASVGVIPDVSATNDAQTEVAENDRATARWLTATAVTFTPTDTPTDTPTATDTPTNTYTPTDTFTPTDTDTPTITYTPSDTYTPTITFTPSDTPIPTQTPLPSTLVDKTVYVTAASLSVRSGPGTTYSSEGFLEFQDRVEVQGERDGWYRIEFEDEIAWISAAYTSETRPDAPVNPSGGSGDSTGSTGGSGGSTGGSSGSSGGSDATAPPAGGGCPSLSYTCSQLTCAQAYACLNAGNGGLDRDKDGVPCESKCPGG